MTPSHPRQKVLPGPGLGRDEVTRGSDAIQNTERVHENRALFKAGVELYKSFGYTTAQEGRASAGSVSTMSAVAKAGGLDIDVVAYPDIAVDPGIIKAPLLSRSYAHRFRIGGAKVTLDGSPQGKTAWLTRPYFKAPEGQAADYRGLRSSRTTRPTALSISPSRTAGNCWPT